MSRRSRRRRRFRFAPYALALATLPSLVTAANLPPEADPGDIPHGTPVFVGERLAYQRDGIRLKVNFGTPVVVATADAPQPWGFFQFPTIGRADDGALRVGWHMAPDAAAGYGAARGVAVSRDGGRAWVRDADAPPAGGVELPDRSHLEIRWPKAAPVGTLDLPKSVGIVKQTYGGVEQTMYRLSELPDAVRGVPLRRRAPGAATWTDEWASLEDPAALRYAIQGLLPTLWLGDMVVLPDRSLIAGVYPGFQILADGSIDPKDATFFYRSTDGGHSWRIRGRIPYQPDAEADPKGAERSGFSEPATTRLSDGSLLCVLRTTDGLGAGPMYSSRSRDAGRTWTRPEAFTSNGVLPRLLQLDNGVLVLSSGRPGVQVRFSTDGGRRWTKAYEMLPWSSNENVYDASCGYTGLLPTGPDSFLIAYSDFRYPTPNGPRKAIMVREVEARSTAR